MTSVKARRILALMNDPRNRERMLQSINHENIDQVGPIGGQEHGMEILSEMNSLADDYDQFINSLQPRVRKNNCL